MKQTGKPYDLEERTAKFGENSLVFCRKITQTNITSPLINQLVRSSTSIGANYMEANGASSKKDFANKISLCKKEAQETKHWLRMIAVCERGMKDDIKVLWDECQQLTMIFQKIMSTIRNSTID